MFLEYVNPISERLALTTGARVDWTSSNIDDDEEKLALLGAPEQKSLADVLGSDQFDQDLALWSVFATGEFRLNDLWSVLAGTGYAERAPNLTEMYAAEPFMFLLQNGLNTVTGDPTLDPERLWQLDAGLKYDETALGL